MAKLTNYIPEPKQEYEVENQRQIIESMTTMKQQLNFSFQEDLKNEQACIASPGDLLAHHALTIHRADSNRSDSRSRRALGFVFYGESTKDDAVAHASYQQKLTQEMTAQGKI